MSEVGVGIKLREQLLLLMLRIAIAGLLGLLLLLLLLITVFFWSLRWVTGMILLWWCLHVGLWVAGVHLADELLAERRGLVTGRRVRYLHLRMVRLLLLLLLLLWPLWLLGVLLGVSGGICTYESGRLLLLLRPANGVLRGRRTGGRRYSVYVWEAGSDAGGVVYERVI